MNIIEEVLDRLEREEVATDRFDELLYMAKNYSWGHSPEHTIVSNADFRTRTEVWDRDVGFAILVVLRGQLEAEFRDAIAYGLEEYKKLWARSEWAAWKRLQRWAILDREVKEGLGDEGKSAKRLARTADKESLRKQDWKKMEFGTDEALLAFKRARDRRLRSKPSRQERHEDTTNLVLDGWMSRGYVLMRDREIADDIGYVDKKKVTVHAVSMAKGRWGFTNE